MKQRWYDTDPTLSMAISLLQNALPVHQEMTAKYLYKQLADDGLVYGELQPMREGRILFIFPRSHHRSRLERHSRQLLELLKHMPYEIQQRVALQMIHYIYILDAGSPDDVDFEGLEARHEQMHIRESG